MTLPGPAYALGSALTWGVAVVLFKRSGETFHPVGLNTFKNVLSLALFPLTIAALGEPLPDAPIADWAWLLASGALGIGVADTLFFKSLNLLGAGRSAIVDCTYAPAVVTAAWLVLGERLEWMDAAGAALIVSAVLLAGARRGEAPIARRDLALGIACGVGAMSSMAVAVVAVKPILERYDVLWSTTVRLVGGIAAIALWIATDPSLRRATLRTFVPQPAWRFALPAAIAGNYVSMLLWIAGFKYNDANVASILNQTATLFTVLLAAAFLREPLTPARGAAVVLGFMGSVLVLL